MTSLSIQAIRSEDLKRSEAQLDQAIGYLAKRKVDCIIVGGAPIFRDKRAQGVLEFIKRVNQETGISTTTSQVATVDAVRHLGIKRLAIATPYPDDQSERIAQYWRASGFDVGEVRGMGRQIDEIQDIPLGIHIWRLPGRKESLSLAASLLFLISQNLEADIALPCSFSNEFPFPLYKDLAAAYSLERSKPTSISGAKDLKATYMMQTRLSPLKSPGRLLS